MSEDSTTGEDLSLTTHLVLVRHALPVTGVAAQPPLSPQGREQARRVGDWLRWEVPAAVVSSHYLRALETAEAIASAAGLVVSIDEDLREWGASPPTRYVTPELLGATERGRAFAEGRFEEFVPKHDRAELNLRMRQVGARVAQRWPGRTVILVSHGGAINNLISGVLGATGTFFFNPGYTSICRLDVMSSGRLVVVSVNETGHLVAQRSESTPSAVVEGVA